MTAPFFYHPRILDYRFGEKHPLKPERLRRTVELLARYGVNTTDAGPGSPAEAEILHAPEYVRAVRDLDDRLRRGERPTKDEMIGFGFGNLDNPPFEGMFAASLGYLAATVAAAEAVRDGEPLAFAIGGGLHHAMRSSASGFCIFNDPAIACAVLRRRFERVAYIDIDVHHGDGVQALMENDPGTLTCSVHEDPRTLWPRTGHADEIGDGSMLNVPIPAKTAGDRWAHAFLATVILAVRAFRAEAVVLQLGTDTHYLDRLGHLRSTQQDWIAAVRALRELDLPTVAVGGGGYHLGTVPRMWASAVLTLAGIPYADAVPGDLAEAWEMPTFSDSEVPRDDAPSPALEATIDQLRRNHPLLNRNEPPVRIS